MPDHLPDRSLHLGLVRRFEAAGFRAWPAADVHYDGTWVIRLTPGHDAKRLNSVNPLDPGDLHDLDNRIARAAERFAAAGRPLTFRLSPLAGEKLEAHFDAAGWDTVRPSLVMALSLEGDTPVGDAMDQIPLKDVDRFITAALEVHGLGPVRAPGLTDIIRAIEPEVGLFALEAETHPLASAICVQDRDLAGLFEVATHRNVRGQGYGRRVVLSALKWAKLRGAKLAWLQVEANNEVAIKLYRSIGFEAVYGYHYRRPKGAVEDVVS
ncbi:GNAT family N-acetyltransferase [Tianweitania aestuarii]|uniref:GNAT family N-acetyltransferase n=1 Tax=Tianweitania aestuarii TaxID=2814886 RepID=UPI003262ECE1